ncbi:acetyl-CoA synthetase-like protein [Ramaria rubella]|nr:acetyl-CoA synthetase-like protein [Ramaria rubella]
MAKGSTTFSTPPLDGTLTLDQIYDWHGKHSSEFPAFIFPDESGTQVKLTWKGLRDGIHNGIDFIKSRIPEARINYECKNQPEEPITVGILAAIDNITYTTFLIAHMRLTHPGGPNRALLPFPISPRNSAAAIAHLIYATGIRYLWVTEGAMRTLADEALIKAPLADIVILPVPSFSDLYTTSSASNLQAEEDNYPTYDLNGQAIILHSSGSTAFPKPRVWTHAFLLELSQTFRRSNVDLRDDILSVHTAPIFHGMGLFSTSWSAASGCIRATGPPRVSPPPLTPELFLQYIVQSRSTVGYSVPSFIEAWAADPDSVKALRKLKVIYWGGAPLRPEIGRFLQREGVSICGLFASTEIGTASIMSTKTYAEGYEWFQFLPRVTPVLIPEPDEERIFEFAIKKSDLFPVAAYNTEFDGVPGYASNDLIEQHPKNPKLFRVHGRKDDQIILSNGEKTNPGPLEHIIVKNPHVKSAVMFGRGRLLNGILIEPTSPEEAESLGLEKFRNMIWPSIDAANDYAPAHSRIFKETIILASVTKPFSYTPKLTVRRGFTLKDYEPEIEAMYQAVQESSQTEIPAPPKTDEKGGWTLEESLHFVHEAVRDVIKGAAGLKEDDDIFGYGCDSLQATYIRNTILHGLRQVLPVATVRKVPSNFIYQHPTIRALARFIAQFSHTVPIADAEPEAKRKQRLESYVTRYTQNWPVHRPTKSNPTEERILLTGSTGGFGSQILAQLLAMPSVSRIYAFNRSGQKTSYERHLEAFLDRGNDVTLLNSDKLVFVEGDSAVDGFNIKPELFEEIRDSVTTIIHNAWRVDFNLSLASYEPAIGGVRNMIDLALRSPHTSPPGVMFISTIGIIKSWANIPPVAEAPVTDIALINTPGYSESKWVSERILFTAAQSTVLRPVVVRVGQLSGGVNGNWNAHDWFPALVRASQVIKGVPDNAGRVSFLPLHVAASSLIELRHTSSQVVHLVHPRPVPWMNVIQHVADTLRLPVIPYGEWLSRLEAMPRTHETLQRNPALHLIDFYRVSAPLKDTEGLASKEAMGMATYETKIAAVEALSLSSKSLPQLGKEDVACWIEYWNGKGALQAV